MQIMKHFVPSYWLVKWLWYRVYNQKVASSSPRVCVCVCVCLLYWIRLISFIIDVPRPWGMKFWIILFQKFDA